MSDDAPPANLIHRFGLFVGRARQAIVSRLERGGEREGLAPLGLVLWSYLGRTLLRLASLQARFAAGTLRPGEPRERARRRVRPPIVRTAAEPMGLPGHPTLPRGPVLLRFHAAHLAPALAELIDDPQMQALLAASPQAGRLLRPLWRRFGPERLPPVLRLPAGVRPPRSASRARRTPPTPPTRQARRVSRWRPHWSPHGPMPPASRPGKLPAG